MREEMNDLDLEQVVGGTVIISKDHMVVGFSTTREKYPLQNVSYRDARDYVEQLLDDNPGMSNAEFDAFAKGKLHDRGWIHY